MLQKIVLSLLLLTIVYSCDEPTSTNNNTSDSFDRGALLTNLADNIIIPAFEDLTTQLTALKNKKDDFIASPNQSTLTALRTAWLDAYKAWQHVEMYNIGEAEKTFYTFQMNVYPANTSKITDTIETENVDLTNPFYNDAVGFPALDYMLFGLADSDSLILEKYTTATGANKYKNYLSLLIDQMLSITQNVSNDWKKNYRNTFVSSTDNTTSSSLNKFVNDFIFYTEKIFRANKFGIPAGNFSDTSLPEKVEGYYSKEYSKQLAQESFQSIKNTFYGISLDGTDGKGLDDYLKHLNKTELLNAISSQFDVIDTQLQGLNNNLSQQVVDDNTKMTEIYDAIQKSVVLFKVDMLQAFGIRVDYADADGD
ncbi:MAG: imelysin family protein [Flavobacteriales bacterium]|nr:imelysin family protein [Flavobacteriales bacterium]